jgi:F0F1-type ATP synthase membrane subunit b/b'
MGAVTETLNLLIEEIASNPVRFIVEVVQFAILVVGFWVLAIGTRKRKGILVNAIDRQARQAKADLALVESAPSILESARSDSERIRAEARSRADSSLREATMEAESIRRDAKKFAEDESSAILERADIAVQTEEAEMHAEVRDLLVNIVADATRSVMNEQLSLPEQRELIQHAILASVGHDSGKTASTKKRRSATRPVAATPQSEVS